MPPSSPLSEALASASPRLRPTATPLRAIVIQATITGAWIALFVCGLVGTGALAWAAGVVYIGYDTLLLAFVAWQTRDLFRSVAGPVLRPDTSVRLAAIVAARNEAAVLSATLAALFAQSHPPDLVVVADDGSDDGTAALLGGTFGLSPPALGTLSGPGLRHPGLRWLRLPHGGKAAALNAALLLLDTDMVLTVDADTLLERDAVAAMRQAFAADPALVAATGILRPICGRTVSGRLFQWFQTFEYLRNFLSRYAWMRADSLLLISGAFAAFRTEPLRQVGGFDAACLVEDYELIHRLRRFGVDNRLGWTTAVVGGARGVTEAPGGVGAFLKQRRRWFGGFLQTQFWYRDMIGNRAYGSLGRWMLPVKSLDTMQPIFGLTAFGLLLVFVVTGRFGLVGLVVGIMGAKLALDLAFHLWSIRLYRSWVMPTQPPGFLSGVLAALVEPFSFQLCRHLGAALGWVTFLRGRQQWDVQRRFGAQATPAAEAALTAEAPAAMPGRRPRP